MKFLDPVQKRETAAFAQIGLDVELQLMINKEDSSLIIAVRKLKRGQSQDFLEVMKRLFRKSLRGVRSGQLKS